MRQRASILARRALCALGFIVFCTTAIGCSSSAVHQIPISPQMKQFVEGQYQDVVTQHVPAHDTAAVGSPRSMSANYNVSDGVSFLTAEGPLDIQTESGKTVKGSYQLRWRQPGDASQNSASDEWILDQQVIQIR
ncbi:MAG TPA: hypothetical protein VH370_15290 [Humisphaera sp.]|jgi:hypothetical protein|nr:hypothetical protein [Humisphaera sp.]